MMLVAVSGYKDSGKSTLCRALLAALGEAGCRTGYIKRTQECVASPAGTDSGDVTAAGVDALLWGDASLRFESVGSDAGDRDPRALAGRFFPDADIVILEGGKELRLPKIWVLQEGERCPEYPGIFALYDRYGPGNGGDCYGAEETGRLAAALRDLAQRESRGAVVYIDDAPLPMKDFVADFVAGGLRGMLRSLKGAERDGRLGAVRAYLPEEGAPVMPTSQRKPKHK